MGGSKSSKSDGKTEVRYAPYVEDHHQSFLNDVGYKVDRLIDESPYEDFSNITVDDGFFGAGYALASFPSLYDMFGKFMAGLDIEVLSNQMMEDTVNSSTVGELVRAESELLQDHVDTKIMPKFQTGMRDINSVMSSSYIVGKAIIADSQVKALSKFSGELKYRLVSVAVEKWKAHLQWNQGVIESYSRILKLFVAAKMDTEEHNQRLAAKNSLWPFTVLEYQRAALGALQGATNQGGGGAESSQIGKSIGGAMSGAATGFMVSGGNPLGAVVGGGIGLAASFF